MAAGVLQSSGSAVLMGDKSTSISFWPKEPFAIQTEIETDFPFHDMLTFPGTCSMGNYFCRSASEVALGENFCLNR